MLTYRTSNCDISKEDCAEILRVHDTSRSQSLYYPDFLSMVLSKDQPQLGTIAMRRFIDDKKTKLPFQVQSKLCSIFEGEWQLLQELRPLYEDLRSKPKFGAFFLFQFMDPNNTYYLDAKYVHEFLRKQDQRLSMPEIYALLRRLDSDNDGLVSYLDFKYILCGDINDPSLIVPDNKNYREGEIYKPKYYSPQPKSSMLVKYMSGEYSPVKIMNLKGDQDDDIQHEVVSSIIKTEIIPQEKNDSNIESDVNKESFKEVKDESVDEINKESFEESKNEFTEEVKKELPKESYEEINENVSENIKEEFKSADSDNFKTPSITRKRENDARNSSPGIGSAITAEQSPEVIKSKSKFVLYSDWEKDLVKIFNTQIAIDKGLDELKTELCSKSDFTLSAAYNFFDKKNRGSITTYELSVGLDELRIPHTSENLLLLMRRYDLDTDGNLNFEEFTRMLSPVIAKTSPKLKYTENKFSLGTKNLFCETLKFLIKTETVSGNLRRKTKGIIAELLDAFGKCDENKKGFLSKEDLFELMQRNNLETDGINEKLLMNRYDKDLDGKISTNEVMFTLL